MSSAPVSYERVAAAKSQGQEQGQGQVCAPSVSPATQVPITLLFSRAVAQPQQAVTPVEDAVSMSSVHSLSSVRSGRTHSSPLPSGPVENGVASSVRADKGQQAAEARESTGAPQEQGTQKKQPVKDGEEDANVLDSAQHHAVAERRSQMVAR